MTLNANPTLIASTIARSDSPASRTRRPSFVRELFGVERHLLEEAEHLPQSRIDRGRLVVLQRCFYQLLSHGV